MVSRHQLLRFSGFVAVLLVGLLGCVRARGVKAPVEITAKVVDDQGRPVSGVEISHYGGAVSVPTVAYTDSNGEVTFPRIPSLPAGRMEEAALTMTVPRADEQHPDRVWGPAGSFSIQLEEGRTSYRVTTTLGYVSDFDSGGRLISRIKIDEAR